MAAVEVTISGVLYDKLARTMRPVVLIGEASLTGLGIGGGPIIPPDQPPPGGGGPVDPGYGQPAPPDVIWGGRPPGGGGWPGWGPPPAWWPGAPSHPIPPTIWPNPGHPAHPIVIPPTPIDPPPDSGNGGSGEGPVKPPPATGGWGYWTEYGWGFFPAGSAGPKK